MSPHHTRLFMRCLLCLFCLALPALSGGAHAEPPVSWRESVQPIFEQKCVACHACNDAPCQLKLGSGEGVERGASHIKVYDSTRTRPQAPTRLFVDALSTAEWRAKGFYSVIGDDHTAAEASLLARMIDFGRDNGLAPYSRLPDDIELGVDRNNQCPANAEEFDTYRRKHPHEGMPLGVSGLTDREYGTLKTWLAQGAKVDSRPVLATLAEDRQIAEWETLLNRPGLREQLVARWLYEHLFLAHLYFQDIEGSHFFELVRSHTPPGQPIDLIATPQPNDAPGGPLYYRLRPVQGVIVHKTHITYPLSAAKIARIQELFFSTSWTVDALPGYSEPERANPFTTFAAIPARARYQFMLDNAEYFVRTFIRGPVCRGNIATDVIRDNFWVFFQSPDSDIYITDAQHRDAASPLLGVPGQKDELIEVPSQWYVYTKMRNEYTLLRDRDYARLQPGGARFEDIWDGDGNNDNALLSVFRHYNSASVRKGLVGEIPQTMWWFDYPLFERTYYGLVANFNVFDTVAHQALTRLYFDLIRHGAELNFLRLMPPGARQPLVNDWYRNSGRFKMWFYYPKVDTKQPVAIGYDSKDPKTEFSDMLLERLAALNARPDPINRCRNDKCYRRDAPEFARHSDQLLSRLAARPAASLPVVDFLPECTLLRIYTATGQREIYTVLRNRAHSNVAYLTGESLRYEPEKDTLTIYPGILTSYPNFAFNVPADEVDDFTAAMAAVKSAADMENVVKHWGVRRMNPDFWALFHDYTEYMREHEPVEAALLDANRYENL